MYGKKFCEVCGESLGHLPRPDKRTCSDKCRQQLRRRGTQIQNSYQNVMSNLGTLRDLLKRQPVTAPTINPLLERLEQEIRDLRRLRPDDDTKARVGMEIDYHSKR